MDNWSTIEFADQSAGTLNFDYRPVDLD